MLSLIYREFKYAYGKYFRKYLIVILFIGVVVVTNLFFVDQISETKSPGSKLAGSKSCESCHAEIYSSHVKTAHYRDSRPADTQTVLGSFQSGKNQFQFNDFMTVLLTQDGNRLIQTAFVNGEEIKSAPIDMVIGSGRNGQTYFTWDGNKLFQLPISWSRLSRGWCNSPGFPGYALFERRITLNCMECHTTLAPTTSESDNNKVEFDRSSIVYGIDCEKCHGPAADHVAYQQEHSDERIGKYIINTSHLNRQLRVDACALCHSGRRFAIKPVYTFQPGDSLEKFSIGKPVSKDPDTLDVHGNQYGLLSASKCYIKSPAMDCSTCHNVHENQYHEPALFSTKCMSCHNDSGIQCKVKTKKHIALGDNCIDCHMPVLPSAKITLFAGLGKRLVPDSIRTHYITVYRGKSRQYLRSIK